MNAAIEYSMNKTSATQIAEHLSHGDADFVPPLSTRVEIRDYAIKIASKATRLEAWSSAVLVGLLAAYCDDLERGIAYITSVSVLREWTCNGIAEHLMRLCIEHAKMLGMRQISLEVARDNVPAIKLYKKVGFFVDRANMPFVGMSLNLKG